MKIERNRKLKWAGLVNKQSSIFAKYILQGSKKREEGPEKSELMVPKTWYKGFGNEEMFRVDDRLRVGNKISICWN